jgi:hypothetical protein
MNNNDVILPFPKYAIVDIEKAKNNSYINKKNIAKSIATELVQKATLNSNKVPNQLKIPKDTILTPEQQSKKVKFICPCPLHEGDIYVTRLQRVHVGDTRVSMIKRIGNSRNTHEIIDELQNLCMNNENGQPSINELLTVVAFPFVQSVLDTHTENSVVFACPVCNHKCDNDKHPDSNFIAIFE